MGTLFDSDANLLRYPGDTRRHAVRESLWYAAGLLQTGHSSVALRVFDAVLALQFDRPAPSGTERGRARPRNRTRGTAR
jgi:hypothetical protein